MSSYWDENYSRDTSWSTWTSQAQRPKPKKKIKVDRKMVRPTGRLNAVLLWDVTSSMQHFLENAKAKIGYFLSEAKRIVDDIQVAVVGIGDYDGKKDLFQPTAFCADPEVLKNNMESMVFCDGDDVPEAFEEAFRKMAGWDLEGSHTVVLLVTDSIPHGMPGWTGRDGHPEKKPLAALEKLRKKVQAFYLLSCASTETMLSLQRQLVDEDHFVRIRNFKRLTNVVVGILAREAGCFDEYVKRLEDERGVIRSRVVLETLGCDPGRG